MKTLPSKSLFATVSFLLFLQGCASHLPELPVDSSSLQAEPLDAPFIRNLPVTPVTQPAPITQASPVTATPVTTPANADNSQALTFVARDLVSALAFISGVSPNQISITAPTVNSKFDWLVQAAMLRNGYTLGNRYGRSRSKQLTTSYLQKDRPDGLLELTGILSIDSILVRRSYLLDGNSIQPGTSYMIRGVDPQLVETTALVDSL